MKTNKRMIKIITIMILAICLRPTKTFAKCYYMDDSGDNRATINGTNASIVKIGNEYGKDANGGEKIQNLNKSYSIGGHTAPSLNGNSCPISLVLLYDKEFISNLEVVGFNSKTDAQKFAKDVNGYSDFADTWYTYYVYNVTKEQYDNSFKSNEIIGGDTPVNCENLFGDKNDPNSLRYIIDKIMKYVRIIVPILVIVFGSIDLGKAVLAGKEENMKKAQATFIKRVIIGVCVFLIPVLVDVIMYIADVAWKGIGYTSCGL